MTDIRDRVRESLAQHRPAVITKEIITARVKELLYEVGEDGVSNLTKIAQALIFKAQVGDVPAIKEILDRVEGKVPQAMTGADGGDLVIQIVKYSAHDLTEPLEAKAISGPSVDGVARRN